MSASDSRQRRPLSIQLAPGELTQVAASAEALGLSLSGYVREVLLGAPTPRTKRRARPDAKQLQLLAAELGKIGSNLNQLARLAHQGQIQAPPDLDACIATVDQLLAVLDRERGGDR